MSNEPGAACLLYVDYLGTHYSAANVRVEGLTTHAGQGSEPYCRDNRQPNDSGQNDIWQIAGVPIGDAIAVRIRHGQTGMLYVRDDDHDNTVTIPKNMENRLHIVTAP